ncbi:hypothetical protein [Gallibacterium genomosp. 1]|uniref:Uncharacterized protein n=1 Tax=Gallibacterium genomosp. 1 TaxID=155515 RepID=A0A0A2Y1I3_9PAST|nr:hypothetical protein [Gallibacterium genomosp. 1]KGQ36475.1 hypothetical protein JP36_10115 [Gallibacterium genomosp. 1]
MPNWCVGDLKIRGKVENIAQFLTECIEGCTVLGGDSNYLEVENIRGQIIKGAGRVYCDNSDGVIGGRRSSENYVFVIPIIAAWRLGESELIELSTRFNVDFRFYGFEGGMPFNQELEVVKGKVTLSKCIEFDDYTWECPCPRLGG